MKLFNFENGEFLVRKNASPIIKSMMMMELPEFKFIEEASGGMQFYLEYQTKFIMLRIYCDRGMIESWVENNRGRVYLHEITDKKLQARKCTENNIKELIRETKAAFTELGWI